MQLDANLPAAAQFWRPTAAEREDGYGGFFCDTWVADPVPAPYAQDVAALERTLVGYAAQAAQSPEEFEMLLCAFEWPDPESVPSEVFGRLVPDAVEQLSDEIPPELGRYELGVAGLVNALLAARITTVASCRGHSSPHSWADYPVVYMVMDRNQAGVLQPLVRRAGCGFQIDEVRPGLVIVAAASVADSMDLADLVLERLEQFPE